MSTFEIVESPEQLERMIAFLSKGFSWSESQTSLIHQSIRACNGESHAYGGWLLDADGRVVNAILFFYQGEIKFNGKIRTVMGTSSWYADEAHKGLASIQFIKRIVDYLKLHYDVLAIYTPTDVATEVHRRLGFKHQNVHRVVLFAWSALSPFGIRKPFIPAEEDQLEYVQGFSYLGHLSRVTVKIGEVNLSMLIRVYKKRKFHLSIPIVEVLWADSYETLSKNLAFVARRLCIRTRAVATSIYVNSSVCDKSCAWMIFDPEDAVSFVSPMQSELTCM